MSELEKVFEEIMASPIMNMIMSIVGVLISMLIILNKMRVIVKALTNANLKSKETNAVLSQKIDVLSGAKDELEKTRKENLELKEDIKCIKKALKLISLNSPQIVSSGAGKEIAKILKEDGVENEKKQD